MNLSYTVMTCNMKSPIVEKPSLFMISLIFLYAVSLTFMVRETMETPPMFFGYIMGVHLLNVWEITPFIFQKCNFYVEVSVMPVRIKGWSRTALLAFGAFLGVMGMAALIHVLKKKGIVYE